MRTQVLVVGAGPAGLVLAALLADHGVDLVIVDAKPGPVAESRAAILHVRTLELLDRLGLARKAVAQGVPMTGVELFERGRRVGSLPLAGPAAGTPFPYALGLEQDRTERLLVDWLAERGHTVEWNTELLALADGPDEAEAVIRRPNGVQETVSARWVVGADGARSAVRHGLGVGFTGRAYDQTGLLADVDIHFPAGSGPRAGALRLNLTRDGFVGMFRLTGGRYRLFGAVPPGFTPPSAREEVSHEPYAGVPVARIQEWFDTYFRVDARLTAATWTALFRIHSRIAERFRAGNVFLVGDAAHIHSPAGGQGMNLAIGDAFNLGWKLALVANEQAHGRLLDSYEAERRPVAEAMLRGTDRAFALETLRHPIARWARSHIAGRLLGPLTRLPVVRAGVFRLFSQTWIGYRHSPAVATGSGDHGGPRPGDRAPYGHLETKACDLFDLIGGTRHHVLLFESDATHRRQVQDLLRRYAMDVRVHALPAAEKTLHARYAVRGPRLFLIRPDGHLAYTGSPDEIPRFTAYLDRLHTARSSDSHGEPPPD
ncbi:FAD-dependent monooxygenase [Nonomuraea sp. NPDC050643]|uniref:FAD-dependent monooxygenase n=1 Tax=Nonomuraea sp. NPDC050643 TaxID=3155660 RepID=UPI00340ADF23